MDPRDTPEQAEFRSEVRSWLAETASPYREAWQASDDSRERLQISADWQGELFTAGYGALGWPAEHGGTPGGAVQRFIVGEECANVGVPWHLNMSVTLGWCAPAINDYGTSEQKSAHLKAMLSGQQIWCQLFSEPSAGSDLASLTTTAQRVGDEYIINGQKVWSSGAHWSSYGILLARTDPQGARYSNLSFFLCDMSAPGIEVRPITQITGERDFCEVFFTDARLPATALVGEEGMGWQVAVHTLLNERIGLSGGGGMGRLVKSAWDNLVATAKPNFGDASVRQQVGDLYVRMVCNRWTALRTLDAVFKGKMPGPEASILKIGSDDWIQDVHETCYAMSGLAGSASDGTWARGLLTSRAMTIGGGTSEVQRNIVGERVLGLPREPKPRQS